MNIGIVGCGNIGSVLYKLIIKEKDKLYSESGIKIGSVKVCDRNDETKTRLGINEQNFTKNYSDLTTDPEIDIIVELTGTIDAAKEILIDAFKNKKSVVTANKALIANHAKTLFNASKEAGVEFRFEAAVGGCIPIIKTICQSYASDEIESLYGILNGTTNYILTRMEQGLSYETALKEAQEKGFAEPDPSSDVQGTDAAQKVVVLGTIINKSYFEPTIFTEGIDNLSLLDMNFAKEMGYKIKLLGMVKKINGSASLKVHPAMIPALHPLAKVDSEFNALFLKAKYTKDSMLYGKGAGPEPTSTVILGDIIDIIRGSKISYNMDKSVKSLDINYETMRYYLRFNVLDKPGVLGKIATIMGKHNISISGAVQKEGNKEIVPVIMTTSQSLEKNMKLAVEEIDSLDFVKAKTQIIRIEDI